jgi:hypothetical protein
VGQISHQTGHSVATISRTCSKHQPELQKSSGGRPTKLSTTNVEYAHQIIRMGKVNNATEAEKTLQDMTNTPFPFQTPRRHLKSRGMRPVVKRNVHFSNLVTDKHNWSLLSGMQSGHLRIGKGSCGQMRLKSIVWGQMEESMCEKIEMKV